MKFSGKSPVRISLCNGGDTDYYIQYMGWSNLINATLSSGSYECSVEENSQDIIEYLYKNTFSSKEGRYEIKNLKENKEENLSLVTTTLKELFPEFRGKIEITTNIPEKSGLGGSTSLVVALLKALLKLKKSEDTTPEQIAWLAYKIERETLGIKGGYQDQWAAAFGGGVNYLEFRKGNVFIEPLWLSEKLMRTLEKNLVLFFLEPRQGDSGNIHAEMEKKMKQHTQESLSIMLERRKNVLATREALLQGDIQAFAKLLNIEHMNKEKLVKNLLTQKSRDIYAAALQQGAAAGKISGAGSGGCAFFIYERQNKSAFIKNMESLGCKHLPLQLQRLNTMGEL